MAIYRNLNGTMANTFMVGKGGTTIRQGTGFPSGGNDGDFFMRRGGTNRAYQRVNGTWVQLQSTQKQTKSTTSNYTTTLPDEVVFADSSGGSITITLGNTTTINGKTITIKDIGGSSSSNNISIVGQSGQLIDGGSSLDIVNNYESVNLISDGTNWFMI